MATMSPVFDYQLENFDPAPDDELICSICRCVFFDPVECPCRHVFCKKCVTQWLHHHKSCPTCRNRISKSTLRDVIPIIRNMIMKLTLLCRNSEKGCRAKSTVELYESHLKICDFEMVYCTNSTCGAVIMRMHKGRHEDTECLFRATTCENCSLNYVFSAEQNHDCVRELLKLIKEKDEEFVKLQEANDALKQEIEKYKMEKELKISSTLVSSDESDISSVTSISLPESSIYGDSDADSFDVGIFPTIYSFSVPDSLTIESPSIDLDVQDISRTEEFLPMDSTNNYSGESPKSSSDYGDGDQFSPVLAQSNSGVASELAVNNDSFPTTIQSLLLSPRRSLKRRMQDLVENAASLDQSTRFNPHRSPFYGDWDYRRLRMAYSDSEMPPDLSTLDNASGSQISPNCQKQGERSGEIVDETIDICDSFAEVANEASSSFPLSESSQSFNHHLNVSASGSNTNSFEELNRSRFAKQNSKRLHGKTHHVDSRNRASNIPCSGIPLPVTNPGSSSTPLVLDRKMLRRPVRSHSSSSEASNERSPNQASFRSGLTNTLSLLSKYTEKESDPDWAPSSDCREESDDTSSATASSKEKSRRWGEDLSISSPAGEQVRYSTSSDSSSSNSESWPTDISGTDSSYEVEVPTTTWELMQSLHHTLQLSHQIQSFCDNL